MDEAIEATLWQDRPGAAVRLTVGMARELGRIVYRRRGPPRDSAEDCD